MSELVQKPEIAALKQSYVVDAVAHHGEPRQPQAEGKSVPLLRIDAAHAQHVWMHQAAGQQLHPSALFTYGTPPSAANQALDVELESRLDEGKVSRPQPHCRLAPED